MKNPIVRFEIGCDNSAKTKAFYEQLFDWKIDPVGAGLAIDTGSNPGGGITSLGHDPRRYTIFYVAVEDVARALERVKGLGGRPLVGPINLPAGVFAWFGDPEGNTVGLWQSKETSR